MSAPEPEPPKREFRFKPTEFERANPAPSSDPGAKPIRVQDILQQASAAKPPARPPPVTPATNEVHELLRANVEHANAAGANDVPLRPKRASRRRRDYWLLMIGVNLFFVLAMVYARNVATLVFGGAGIIFCSLALTWIMWFVMDDY